MPKPTDNVAGEAISVAVVEDNATLRRNFERLLHRTPGFRCACACASGAEALEQIPRSNPQVVLMDIHMPGMSGVECAAQLKRRLPELQIVMLTVYEDTETIFKALRAGASGYLLKRSSPDEVLGAVRDIYKGGAPMTSAIARKIVDAFLQPLPGPNVKNMMLSPREREILDAVAQGLANKEIGARLGISASTVKIHMNHIFEKLHVRSRTEAVMTYLQVHRGPADGQALPVGGA